MQSFILCEVFSKAVRLNTIILMLYKLLPRHCFLLHNQIQHILFFPKSQQVIGTNQERYKRVYHYYFICRCPGLSNRCTFILANQLAGRFAPSTELGINRFRPSSFRYLVWHLSTQVDNDLLAAYITGFDPRRAKRMCFIPFLVYALVYQSIASYLMTLAALSPWSDSLCTHTCYPFLSKPILR